MSKKTKIRRKNDLSKNKMESKHEGGDSQVKKFNSEDFNMILDSLIDLEDEEKFLNQVNQLFYPQGGEDALKELTDSEIQSHLFRIKARIESIKSEQGKLPIFFSLTALLMSGISTYISTIYENTSKTYNISNFTFGFLATLLFIFIEIKYDSSKFKCFKRVIGVIFLISTLMCTVLYFGDPINLNFSYVFDGVVSGTWLGYIMIILRQSSKKIIFKFSYLELQLSAYFEKRGNHTVIEQ